MNIIFWLNCLGNNPVTAMLYLTIEDPNAAKWMVAVPFQHTKVLLSVESAICTNGHSLLDDVTTCEAVRSFRFQLRCWETLFGYMPRLPQFQLSVTQISSCNRSISACKLVAEKGALYGGGIQGST